MTTFSISLPSQVASAIDVETKESGFASRSEFIRILVRKYLASKKVFRVYESKPVDQVKLELAKTGKYSEKFIESVTKGLKKSALYAN